MPARQQRLSVSCSYLRDAHQTLRNNKKQIHEKANERIVKVEANAIDRNSANYDIGLAVDRPEVDSATLPPAATTPPPRH
jgi:hypothetical protein